MPGNSKTVAANVLNFEDAPRASVTTRRKQREGRHLRPQFQGCSTRQRHDVPETARESPLTPRTWRTLHAPASRRAENNERVKLIPRISRTLHAPASRRTENNEKVATYAHNFNDAPRASVTMPGNSKTVAANVLNFEDAPRASVTTRRKQREGRHLRPQFQGCSTRQRHDVPETARESPLTPRTWRTLHAPASRRAENNEMVKLIPQNFKDAPRASVTTRGKQREGRHFRPEFQGRSTRQRHDGRKQREGRYLRPEFRGCSTCQRHDAPETAKGSNLRPEFRGRSTRQRHDALETARGSPLTARISRTLHTPASRCAENNGRVTTYAQNFEDASHASVTPRCDH